MLDAQLLLHGELEGVRASVVGTGDSVGLTLNVTLGDADAETGGDNEPV